MAAKKREVTNVTALPFTVDGVLAAPDVPVKVTDGAAVTELLSLGVLKDSAASKTPPSPAGGTDEDARTGKEG